MKATRKELFVVTVELAEEQEGGRMGTTWKDRAKFIRCLETLAGFWAQHETAGQAPVVTVNPSSAS